ncbi:MAG: PAS domain S-box protein [Planctomycetes bacterium]|nr:PAS domain S-box protein [Planctomycetota bacterium]
MVLVNRLLAVCAIWVTAILSLQRVRDIASLQRGRDELEQRVQKQTVELDTANEILEQEIEERKRAEVQLKKLSSAIEQTADLILITDRDGLIEFVNPAFEQLTGYSSAEVIGLTPRFLKSDKHEQEWYEDLWNTILSGDVFRAIFINRKKNGKLYHEEKTITPLKDENGQITHFVSTGKDISGRVLAEQALRTREQQQAVVAKLGQEALAGMDLSKLMNKIVYFLAKTLNVEYCKVLKLLPDGKSLLLRSGVGWKDGLVGRATVPAGKDSQAGYTLHSGEPVVVENLRTEKRFHGPGLLFDHGVVSGMSVIIAGYDVPFGVLGVHTTRIRSFTKDDINFLVAMANLLAEAIQRKRSEEDLRELNITLENKVEQRTVELQATNTELNAFAYSVSHDLRAPLRAMHGFAEALLQDNAEQLDRQGREFAERIVGAADRMDGLIQDVLTYSRIGRSEIHFVSVNLADVVDECLVELESEIWRREAQISVERPLPEVLSHRATLVQIVRNLLSNAMKFVDASKKPQVQIRAESQNGSIFLYVEDNGIGILPEHQEKVFSVFERLHGNESYSGTGIGLAIVRRAAESLGGRVGLESSPGAGSRFWVEIPQKGLRFLKRGWAWISHQ